MRSRQIAQGLFLAAGIAIVVLLIVPAVRVPFVVIHGPVTALRAQRSAWLFILLLRAAAFLYLGRLFAITYNSKVGFGNPPPSFSTPLQWNWTWRC